MQNIPATMRAVLLTGHGGLDRLHLSDQVPVPTVGSSDVLIRVSAAAVNNTDINTREAWYSKGEGSAQDASWSGDAVKFPRIQGADVCGHIVKVGGDVPRTRLGERVIVEPLIREAGGHSLPNPWYFGSECDGGFAEYTVVASRHAYTIRSELSDVELASFPCSYSTAENLLTRAGVKEGDVVLITGASGGVGSAAIQLAKARDAYVCGVTSARKVEPVQRVGADRVLVREDDLTAVLGRNTVDVVIDLVAGRSFPHLLDVLKPFGRYAVAGAIAGPIVDLDARTLYLKDLTLVGCTVLDEPVFGQLVKRIEDGEVSPLVSRTFPLENVTEAQTEFVSRRHIGKIVLVVNSE